MTRTLYELVGAEDRRFSPYCWRVRMALAHKGLDAALEPVRFTEKHKLAFSGQKLVPVLVDGDRVVADSWAIACYLDDAYPDAPSLLGGPIGRATARFLNLWTDGVLHADVTRCVLMDIHAHLDPEDQAYFRESREARFGKPLEEAQGDREANRAALRATLAPLRRLLREQPWVSGASPAYGDYIVFGAFQWARCISPFPLLDADDPVHGWRARMLDLHGGIARQVPAYEV